MRFTDQEAELIIQSRAEEMEELFLNNDVHDNSIEDVEFSMLEEALGVEPKPPAHKNDPMLLTTASRLIDKGYIL